MEEPLFFNLLEGLSKVKAEANPVFWKIFSYVRFHGGICLLCF
jgi:hypothetical protein